jgi:hypothetical protein
MMQDALARSEVIDSLQSLSPSELSDVKWADKSLLAIVRDDSIRLVARLYACEVLLRRDQEKYLGIIGAPVVAAIYVSALKEKATTDLNPWAFLGLGEPGSMGRHLVACGSHAVEKLVSLLDIKQLGGIYSGSEESKEGNADWARICDFAAFFTARIKGWPFLFHRESMVMRDEEIRQIKKSLEGNAFS